MNDDEKESEYYTITELLQEMNLGKAIGVIVGFFSIVGSIAMIFAYWFTRHK